MDCETSATRVRLSYEQNAKRSVVYASERFRSLQPNPTGYVIHCRRRTHVYGRRIGICKFPADYVHRCQLGQCY
eukprot:3848206-Karenia_brevis.AAC.1